MKLTFYLKNNFFSVADGKVIKIILFLIGLSEVHFLGVFL